MRLLSHNKGVTRKPHRCWGCCKTFPKGTTMYRVVTKDGGLATTYWCEPCQAFVDRLAKQDPHAVQDGMMEGDVKEWMEEDARQNAIAETTSKEAGKP